MHYPTDEPWKYLIRQIHQGKCVPFLGAGISAPSLPLAKDLANNLAKEFDYPLKEDSDNLSKVSQFIEIQHDKSSTKERVCEIIAKVNPPDFTKYKDTPHAILAKLDFPLYITTNYDKFMEEALKSNGKIPISDFCRWTEDLEEFGNYNEINSDLYKGNNNRFKIYL